jgi:hypothetical protein
LWGIKVMTWAMHYLFASVDANTCNVVFEHTPGHVRVMKGRGPKAVFIWGSV